MTERIPRTLHLLVHASGGGTETNVNRLCREVHNFEVLSLQSVMGFPLAWWKLPGAIRAIRERNPEVVFCYGITSHMVAALACPRGTPLVGNIRCESDFAGAKGFLRRVLHRRFRLWVSNSRKGLETTGIEDATPGEEAEWDPRRIGGRGVVVYNGISEPPGEAPLFDDLPRPVMAILARESGKKGHRFMLRLWTQLGKPGTLIFAGSLSAALRREAQEAGVLCPGFVDAGRLIRSLDILLVPSSAEGIPTVLLEAMVRGVPCLATPVGGIPELIRHNENGFLLERREWKRFLESLDWNHARRVGAAACGDVLANHTFRSMRHAFIAAARAAASPP